VGTWLADSSVHYQWSDTGGLEQPAMHLVGTLAASPAPPPQLSHVINLYFMVMVCQGLHVALMRGNEAAHEGALRVSVTEGSVPVPS
jgi:hypothetical protein